jgi:hypothetical protein
MKTIAFQYLPPTGPDSIESTAMLDEFLISLPSLLYMGYIPPRNIVNLFLDHGVDEAGMSGGAEWEPFSIDQGEYDELLSSLKGRIYINQEYYTLSLTDEIIETKNEWYAKVMEHKLGIPYKRHLELMEREQHLQQLSEEAYEKGDKELGDKLHIQWYHCANELSQFCEEYFNKPA